MTAKTKPTLDIMSAEPPTLNHVVPAQMRAVQQLQVALAAHWNDRAVHRNLPFGPVLVQGPDGTGKRMLGRVIARELGCAFHEMYGPTLCMGDDVHAMLMEADDNTVLFVTEAQGMNQYAQTLLSRAIASRRLKIAEEPFGRKYIDTLLARFTTILSATTLEGLIPPLRGQMSIVLNLAHYTPSELAAICHQRAGALNWTIKDGVVDLVAASSEATASKAMQLMRSCRRVASAEGVDTITQAHLDKAIDLAGIDRGFGLDRNQQAYLRALAQENGTMALASLAQRLAIAPRSLAGIIERCLFRKGLIERTEAGIKLTAKGWVFARAVPADHQ